MFESPAGKKPKRFQEAVRPTYGLLRQRIETSKCARALEAASLCQLHGMFLEDYPRFKDMPENMVAGYLLSHMAARRGLGFLRQEGRSAFEALSNSSDWYFTLESQTLQGNLGWIKQIAQGFLNWSPVLLDMDDMAAEENGEKHAFLDGIPYRRSQVQVMSQQTIHDIDKPRYVLDSSVRDRYGHFPFVRPFLHKPLKNILYFP